MYDLIYILATISTILAISASNPVIAVLNLIITFIFIAGILSLLGTDFVAILYLIIYIGAVLVLFLFVVMLVNMRIFIIGRSLVYYIPISTVFIFLSLILIRVLYNINFHTIFFLYNYSDVTQILFSTSNIVAVGNLLYSYYVINVIAIAIVLLISLLGSVMLTKVNYVEKNIV